MRLSIRGLALAAGLLGGGAMLLTGLLHLVDSSYAVNFLEMMGSVYPGFHAARNFGDLLLGAFYGFVDGGIAGLLFGWLYNLFGGHLHEGVQLQGAHPSAPAPAR
ncbi:MAG TPA: hypothetical protein VL099_05315 [Candidatus Binatia bacterium]|nr:hypothetical protein [Candidatus Solibacter sp.]HUK52692.1 hypothetical protein [Candidatus Binatia bacterium]